MQCDKGTVPGPLYVPPRFPTLAGQPWCNTADRDPVLNKFNFGVCAVTQKPCLATCQPLRWLDVSKEVEVAGTRLCSTARSLCVPWVGVLPS